MPGKILAFIFATSLLIGQVMAEEIHFATVDYPPFYGSELEKGGPITEIVTEAYKKVGHTVEVDYMPWARAMREAKSGKADGLLGAWYSDERAQWFVFSDPLPGNEVVLFKRSDAKPQEFTSYVDLKPYKIGIVRGYRNPPEFDAADLDTEVANSDEINLIKLAKNRIDLIVIDRATAKHIIAKKLPEYSDSLQPIEPPLEVLPLYILFSKKTDDHVKKIEDFNRGLQLLEAEGGIKKILERHGL